MSRDTCICILFDEFNMRRSSFNFVPQLQRRSSVTGKYSSALSYNRLSQRTKLLLQGHYKWLKLGNMFDPAVIITVEEISLSMNEKNLSSLLKCTVNFFVFFYSFRLFTSSLFLNSPLFFWWFEAIEVECAALTAGAVGKQRLVCASAYIAI